MIFSNEIGINLNSIFLQADCVISTSPQEVEDLRQLISPPGRIKVIPCGINIASVGTEIYQRGVFLEKDWTNQISKDWDRDAVGAIASYFSALIPQPDSKQTPWKLSFCLDMDTPLEVIHDLGELLNFTGLQTEVIFSNGRDVDIIPKNSNKGKATVYLQDLLRSQSDATIVCGGSGNAISLFQLPSAGIRLGILTQRGAEGSAEARREFATN
ncbi:MAG: HAD family hydrolase [Nostoc sp.]|uniref:HAD family hydrolase n=1 Tax=Nostoc sp. TaxID=1180 RepID=UPI002FF521C2